METCENCLYWDTFGLCDCPESKMYKQSRDAVTVSCDSFVEFVVDDACEGCRIGGAHEEP